ncbi:hypothetical protein C2G38_2180532 [Gigaspora rosea]|uniref:Uncharacterized protein n=1 Tax=Gigaspora rosea TaxID=44941 RepID=A0A397VJ69_9GLOM|nr:hypothetical protein C2G38_2180532 [Gigaspora rosea]
MAYTGTVKYDDEKEGLKLQKKNDTELEKNIKEFLQSDFDITNSETLKNLTDEAIKEDTMDSYYNILKSYKKKTMIN